MVDLPRPDTRSLGATGPVGVGVARADLGAVDVCVFSRTIIRAHLDTMEVAVKKLKTIFVCFWTISLILAWDTCPTIMIGGDFKSMLIGGTIAWYYSGIYQTSDRICEMMMRYYSQTPVSRKELRYQSKGEETRGHR